jgi:C4-dicarboxylate-specific signal transduction histidine kinase
LSLNSVVLEVIALLRTELPRNDITVPTNLAENLRPIRGDRVQKQQVLFNLITTAIGAHGGRLWAVSNAPAGVILRFTLPFEGAGTG